MGKEQKNVKKVEDVKTKDVKTKIQRVKPLGVMLFYKQDAVAMGFSGEETDVSALIKNKVRQSLNLPAPERSTGQNAVLKATFGLLPTATTNELNKAMKQAILSGKFKPLTN